MSMCRCRILNGKIGLFWENQLWKHYHVINMPGMAKIVLKPTWGGLNCPPEVWGPLKPCSTHLTQFVDGTSFPTIVFGANHAAILHPFKHGCQCAAVQDRPSAGVAACLTEGPEVVRYFQRAWKVILLPLFFLVAQSLWIKCTHCP